MSSAASWFEAFGAGLEGGCYGVRILVAAKPGLTITWIWLAGGVNTYQETLKVTDSGELTNSVTQTITIAPLEAARKGLVYCLDTRATHR